MPPRLHLNRMLPLVLRPMIQAWGHAAVVFLIAVSSGFCAEVDIQTARMAAENQLNHHVSVFGDWNGSDSPAIGSGHPVNNSGKHGPAAYHFDVNPSGYILVASDDDLSPIPFYSTRAAFHPDGANKPNAIESWIVPEISDRIGALRRFRSRRSADPDRFGPWAGRSRARAAWDYLKHRSARSTGVPFWTEGNHRNAVVGPLLTTAWGQGAPYNSKTPDDGCADGHTLAGCVATAWAQVLRYHGWPDRGVGTGRYVWNGVEYRTDFSDAKGYDWDNMPDILTEASPQAHREAVGWLIYFAGMAAETEFGCDFSGSAVWASDVFAEHFKYKNTLSLISRYNEAANPISANYDAVGWFDLFKTELDQGRLVIFSIFSDSGGHEVVADGYDDTVGMVHINYGWDGNSDGYYNISDDADFNTAGYDWYVDRRQYIVIGIAPDRSPSAGGGGGGGCFVLSLLQP
jgi:hypothetical protein